MKGLIYLFSILLLLSACHTDRKDVAITLYQEGKRMEVAGRPDSAVYRYRKAITLLDGLEYDEWSGRIQNDLGNVLLDYALYDRARDAYRQASLHCAYLTDKTLLSASYRGLGKSYYLQENYPKALEYFLRAFRLPADQVNDEERSSVYNNLSNVYLQLKDYRKALRYNRQAIHFTRDSLKIYRNYSVRGKLFTLIQQYDSAYYYLLQGSRSGNARIRSSCFYKLSEMPGQAGMSDSMRYQYLTKAQILSDSIEDTRKIALITEAEYSHVLMQLKDEENSKLLRVVLLFAGLCVILGGYGGWRYKRKVSLHRKQMAELYSQNEVKSAVRAQENTNREKQIIAIISGIGRSCVGKFVKNTYYKELRSKLEAEACCFTYAEQEELQKIICKEFEQYIQQLSVIINLSANDALLCCLSVLGFTTKECAVCRGVSPETIRSQRTRIKKKTPKTFLDNGVFQTIFGEE